MSRPRIEIDRSRWWIGVQVDPAHDIQFVVRDGQLTVPEVKLETEPSGEVVDGRVPVGWVLLVNLVPCVSIVIERRWKK